MFKPAEHWKQKTWGVTAVDMIPLVVVLSMILDILQVFIPPLRLRDVPLDNPQVY